MSNCHFSQQQWSIGRRGFACQILCMGVHLPSIYMHCPRSSSGCSSTAYIYAVQWYARPLCLIDWGGPMLNCILLWWYIWCNSIQCIYAQLTGGVHLPSRYMHCPRSSSGCSSMQGICAQLTWEDLCWIALCYANLFGVAVCKASVLDWLGRTSVGLHCAKLICLV